MLNQERYFEKDGITVKKEMSYLPWLQYLVSGAEYYWNAERIEKMADKKNNTVLQYVMRTLDILDEVKDISAEDYRLIRTVLCWSEVAKAGSAEDRQRWRKRGYPLEIHNEASAMIYRDHTEPQSNGIDPVYILIKTHGLAGQFIRGECRMESSRDLVLLKDTMSKDRFCRIIEILNQCIIEAVSQEIYLNVKDRIRTVVTVSRTESFIALFSSFLNFSHLFISLYHQRIACGNLGIKKSNNNACCSELLH